MAFRRGQAVASDLVISVVAFLFAVAALSFAFNKAFALQAGPVDTSGPDLVAASNLLFFSYPEPQNWSYSQHAGAFAGLAGEGGVNLTKAAYLISMFLDNESDALSITDAVGPYRIGFSISNQSGIPVNVSCPACDCGGRCFVTLDYSPAQPAGGFSDAYVASRIVRLVGHDGTGAGIAVAKLKLYRNYG